MIKIMGVALLLAPLFLASCGAGQQRFQAQRIGYFDSFVIFTGYAASEGDFEGYADIVFERLDTLHRLYDIFNPYDGIHNLYDVNASAGISPVAVAPEIIGLLQAAAEAHRITGGAVNVALGPVTRIWREYRQAAAENPAQATLPSMDSLQAAAQFTDMDDVIIDLEKNTVFLRRAGMALDVGTIAKGFAAELAMQAATEAGIKNALLNLGGHVLAVGSPPNKAGWEVYIQNHGTISLAGAVSVSGASERFFTVNGKPYGHIIDPATLMPANRHGQTTVLHECSWMADVLSTALFILPKEEGLKMADENGAEAIWTDAENLPGER